MRGTVLGVVGLVAVLRPAVVLPQQAPPSTASTWHTLFDAAQLHGYTQKPPSMAFDNVVLDVPTVVDLVAASASVAAEPTSADLAVSVSMAARPARGLHSELQLHVKISSTEGCIAAGPSDVLLVFALPSGAYVDEHELESRHAFVEVGGARSVAARVNVHTYRANR